MLEAREIHKSYRGRTILSDINLTLDKNSTTILSGPSGEGKSTLARILALYEAPDEGAVLLDNKLVATKTRIDGKITLMMQDVRGSFDPLSSLGESLVEIASSHSLEGDKLNGIIARDFNALALDSLLLKHRPQAVSDGELARVAIIRSFLMKGEVLIFDEPFRALDEEAKILATKYIEENRGDSALLFIMHEEENESEIKGRRLHLEGGELLDISQRTK